MLRSESRWPQLGLLLLFYELLAAIGLTRIPPVTLSVIALQVCLYLKNISHFLGVWTLWPTSMLCLNAATMLEQNHQWYRILTAPLFHVSDLHLYYNMISFAWKGIRIEGRYGKVGFILLLTLLCGLTGFIYVCLCSVAFRHLSDSSYLNQCAIGFSGVLFALKVLADDSDGDFGLFTVPKKMAVWAELLIIQVLVPNSSFVGHLSGIVAGILVGHMIPFLYDLTVRTPLGLVQSSPVTFFVITGLTAFHAEWIQKPWTTRFFWTSGTPLVCLNANHIVSKGEWFRMLSGPLEHAGSAHFIICLVSIAIKLHQLEQRYPTFRTIGILIMSFLLSSAFYVLTQLVVTKAAQIDASECVEGLSGLAFALKVLVILSGNSNATLLLFEIIECLTLLEKRTLLYHLSGLMAGLLLWMLYLKHSRFPGQGIRLGGGNRPTRGWGCANYSESQFRRVVNTSHDETTGSELSDMSHSMSRNSRSASPSPSMTPVLGPRPRCPPPLGGTCPPPPRSASSGLALSDRESQSPLTEDGSMDIEA